MGWAQQLRDEGRQEGRQEGREEGLAEGQRLLLIRLLERRFGVLSEELRQKISSADEAALTLWGERLLEATSLTEVFALASSDT